MNTLALNWSAAVSSSTSRSASIIPACCGWSATQPRSTCARASRFFCLLAAALSCCATPALAAELKKPGPSPSDALFDPSRVIQIEIRLDPKDWHALRISHRLFDDDLVPTGEGYEYCRADVSIDGREVKSVGVRKKGWWGSSASTRPSLKIKFDEYVKKQEFSGIEVMTLNNLILDPTRAKQSLVYSFMSKAGVPAPRSNLARVVVNGEDLGVYGHVESIDKRFIRREFGNANGDLYESEFGDFTTNDYKGIKDISHKWGNDNERAEPRKLLEVLQTPGTASLKNIEKPVDVDAFITFWAAEVLMGMNDSYSASQNNFFVYRDSRSEKLFFLPWGRDSAFRDPRPKTYPRYVRAAGVLCQRLWELPEIRERYRKEMQRLLDHVWDEKTILNELDQIKRLCAPYYGPAPPEKEFAEIVQFVHGRRKEIQSELDNPPLDPPKPEPWTPRPQATGPLMEITGTFSAGMVEKSPTNLFGHGTAAVEYTIEGKSRKPFTRFGAVAVPNQDLQEYSMLEIVAADSGGTLRWKLQFHIDPYLTTPGKLKLSPIALWADLAQGDPGSPNVQWRGVMQRDRLRGTLELDQASRKIGGTISGKFKLSATAFEEEKKP